MVKPKPQPCTLALPPVALDEQNQSHQTATTPIISNLAGFQRELPLICQRIFQALGSQQSEATYQRCLSIDLLDAGVAKVHLEVELPLTYKGVIVSCRRSDMIVELACGGRALLEFKAVNKMTVDHRKQTEYYLHHSDIDDGYLINFPHDTGFPNVTDKSSFEYSGLAGITEQLNSVVLGGPVLRLRNDPKNREVEVVHILRRNKVIDAKKEGKIPPTKVTAAPLPTLGLTKKGLPCKNCKKENRLCRIHKSQAVGCEV
ncbi:unnamed protein product [Cylindrotheca closterium]|uniref:Uncharacterized protein n=1 Tax=Cylindrotheca closterium TaxID=2856 RepID=A0AAD2CPU6_9STRA|nr:unnamed protein product [Cylindrotheca closterium]